ncbi:hypothetical protein [Methylocella sp.]|uniref:hypothetical protein n=1 Tax=Methylocella sp. TaxID=1978226 RepID=UPI00378530EF
MTDHAPIHSLRDRLETERLAAVEGLAAGASSAELSGDALARLAALQAALSAVREELEVHGVREGWGDAAALR